MFGFGRLTTEFGGTGISRYFGASCRVQEAYNTNTLQFWYIWLDIRFILLTVKFDDGLFISVLKNRAAYHNWKSCLPYQALGMLAKKCQHHSLNTAKRRCRKGSGLVASVDLYRYIQKFLKSLELVRKKKS
jgi:hypothetical protein